MWRVARRNDFAEPTFKVIMPPATENEDLPADRFPGCPLPMTAAMQEGTHAPAGYFENATIYSGLVLGEPFLFVRKAVP
ncbi:MAG: hypothetical protein K0S56_1791 [Microvirga sp.]|jgi:hypothetical protein|nr:hypothetical protein [Microvirga sp.]